MGEPLAALNAGHRIDFAYNADPKCPHCGHDCGISDQEWWHLYEEGEHDVECPYCDAEFVVSTHVKHTFSTDEQEDL